MNRDYLKKEEVAHGKNIPITVKRQLLSGSDCFCPLHWHKDIELNYFIKNSAMFIVNGVQRKYDRGDLLLINSEDIHAGLGDPETPESERTQELITLQVDYDFLKQYYKEKTPLRFRDNLPDEVYRRMKELILEIDETYRRGDRYSDMKLTALSLDLGCILLEQGAEPAKDAGSYHESPTFSGIKKAVAYLEEHYAEDLSLHEIASRMGWADSYFSRKFTMMTGAGYHEYLSHIRLKHAHEDLILTDNDITEIAFDNGFPNIKSFITVFRKAYAITPQQYRIQWRKEHNV